MSNTFAPPAPNPILLSAYAAGSCPVKTQHAFNPRLAGSAREPAESAAQMIEKGLAYEREVLDRWAALARDVVDLRPLAGRPQADQVAALRAAVAGGAGVILGGRLPDDPAGHRTGAPDALVRGADRSDGRPGYHAVEVKWHKVIERDRVGRPAPPRRVSYSTLTAPAPEDRTSLTGCGLRLGSREGDFLQLAHYHRMLEVAGLAAPEPLAAVIGTDALRGEPDLVWVDLSERLIRTFSRSESEGWRWRSLLERYDHEHAFRVDIARRAAGQTSGAGPDPPLLVRPIVSAECGRCPWWEHCRPQLDADDVSLRIDKGALDAREIVTLRRLGIESVTDLAGADLSTLSDRYLPEVRHRVGAESRLRLAARRARMLLADIPFERETAGPIEVPGAEIEVDFDVETSTDGRVYLWGFLVDDHRGPPRVHQVSRFADLDVADEIALAREALGWLRELVSGARSVRVYHYSGYEVAVLRTLADRSGDDLLRWAAAYAESDFVDLLEIVKQHYFGVSGLGLKAIAGYAGFRWRDDDPGGLNSQRWFAEAVHGEETQLREAARRRVLEYNEDDVWATARLRGWLRAR